MSCSSSSDAKGPLFLLGTGRCGSTFWQTLLCRAPGVWIWGEHNGFLRTILQSRAVLHGCDVFQAYAGGPLPGDDAEFQDLAVAARMAWANPFTADDVDVGLRVFIESLMTRALPSGKHRWGFKEIRYGNRGDETPRHLLDLFPDGVVVHMLRHPRGVIESAIRAWGPRPSASPCENTAALRAEYDRNAIRWMRINGYLLDLAGSRTGRVVAVRIEDTPRGLADLGVVLGLELPCDHPPVNVIAPAADAQPAAERALFDELWAAWWPRLQEVAERAGYVG
ncbi:MAG: sulfotransferase [Pirellulales bacterium]